MYLYRHVHVHVKAKMNIKGKLRVVSHAVKVLTNDVNFLCCGPAPGVAWQLAMVGGEECLLLDEPQRCQDVGYVVEPAYLG